MNILCISIDGLHGGMIGAFGNGWIETPTLDALACRSILLDRYYAETTELPSVFDLFWLRNGSKPLPKFYSEKGFKTIFLTDDDEMSRHDIASDFQQSIHFSQVRNGKPAETLEETSFFQMFATIVDLLGSECRESTPFLFWAHLAGFRGNWDFPIEYRERYRGDEDPEPYAGIAVPTLEPEIDPDELQAVMEAYAGGMSVLDDALAGLVAVLEESKKGENTLFALTSTRGFSLGEHGRIGADDSLYGENIHLPLIVRRPGGLGGTTRSSALVHSSDFADFLFGMEGAPSLLHEIMLENREKIRDFVLIRNPNGERALATPDWYLRKTVHEKSDRFQLYAKPDDHWEVNDVANRCPEKVGELAPLLDASPADLDEFEF